jgi:hypothetical protein
MSAPATALTNKSNPNEIIAQPTNGDQTDRLRERDNLFGKCMTVSSRSSVRIVLSGWLEQKETVKRLPISRNRHLPNRVLYL